MYSKWSVYSANFGGLHINHGSEGKLEWGGGGGGGGGGMTADGRGKVDNVISFSLSPLPSPVSCCFVSLPVNGNVLYHNSEVKGTVVKNVAVRCEIRFRSRGFNTDAVVS